MTMKRKLILSVLGIALLIAACQNPFFPEKENVIEDLADPAAPVISIQPQSRNYSVNDIAVPLTVTASVSDGGSLSYRWYSNNINDSVSGTSISNAISSSYPPPTDTAGVIYYYVIVTNTLNGKTAFTASNTAAITVGDVVPTYSIHIVKTGNEGSDEATISSDTGKEGEIVTINYYVAKTKKNNILIFGGTTTHIASVDSAGSGTKQYTVYAADASNGVITIRAEFFHTDKTVVRIEFNDTSGVIHKTYGDPAFTNAVAPAVSGAITYTSSDPSVATVNSSGQVTIKKAGSTIIKAEKEEDSENAYVPAEYNLNVDPKPLTITGLSVQDKTYDESAAATVSDTAELNGKVGSDNVDIVSGTAAFTDANAGTNKQVIFNGWSLSGADAGNYTLSLPDLTANIGKADGRTVSKPASANVTTSSITVGAVTVQPPAYGQTAEYAISQNASPVPSTWQDGTTFSGLTVNTNYYVFARSKSNANCNAGTAQVSDAIKTSQGGTPPEIPRTAVIDFEDKAIGYEYGYTEGDSKPTAVKVVADPANSGQKSLQITANNYNQAAIIPLNLPYELQYYKSFTFRLRIIGGAGLTSSQTIYLYAAKNSSSFVKWGFGNPSTSQNQFAANLVGSTPSTPTLNTWTDYEITISNPPGDAIKNLQGAINIAIGFNLNNAADYLIDDLIFTLRDDHFPEPPFVLPTTPPVPASQGAVITGNYRNLFREMGKSDAEIDAKVENAWNKLFYGTETEKIYYTVGSDMAYILDTGNNDVRSEGMSYGMMICVQLDKQVEFDRLWKWAKTYMYNTTNAGNNSRGYFSWQLNTNGSHKDHSAAPDGDMYFATALLFASARWGDGAGDYDYGKIARQILYDMLRRDTAKGDPNSEPPMFNQTYYMTTFVPYGNSASHTDPSYHLPAFYEIWAEEVEQGTKYWNDIWGSEAEARKDVTFWKNAAQASRTYFPKTVNSTTGLGPDYSLFDGTPTGGNHADFRFDAWRIAMNITVDYAWWADYAWPKTFADTIQGFFAGKGISSYGNQWKLNGTLDSDKDAHNHSPGLVACNAVASLAATNARAWDFLDDFWNISMTTGQYRYYDGCLYMMGMLHCSGNFRAYTSSSGGASSSNITPTSAVFDKRSDLQQDIVVTMNLNGNTLTAIKNGAATLTSGTNYSLSGNTVTINKSYLNTLAVGTTTLTFEFSAGSSRTLSITVKQTPQGEATAITPTTAVFDKREDLQEDIVVTMTLDGNAFSNITNGGVTVAAGNYTLAGNTLTLKSSYLAGLPKGSVTLVFNFTGGPPAITRNLVITVNESPAEGSLRTEYNFATDTIPAGYPTYHLNGGDSGSLPTAVLSGGVLVVTRTGGNYASPIFYLPFNIGTDSLSSYNVVIRMRNVSGADNKNYNIYIATTQIGTLATGLTTSFKDVTISVNNVSTGEVIIGFAQNNSQAYVYEIESIKLVKK
jgi:oligosaccharide reducing-end xylanase